MAGLLRRIGRFLARQWRISGRIGRNVRAEQMGERDWLTRTAEYDRVGKHEPDSRR
jgi:hypothetical protein